MMTSAHNLVPEWLEGGHTSQEHEMCRTVSRNSEPSKPRGNFGVEKNCRIQRATPRSLSATNVKIAAFPKCFMYQLVVERSMSLFEWISMAADLPVEGLEFYDGFFESTDGTYLDRVRSALERKHLEISMMCCSPDFTKPDADECRVEVEREMQMIAVTAALGGRYCRVLSGQRRPEIPRDQGIRWTIDCIRELLDYAAGKNVVLTFENHYKDNYWRYPEFA